MIVNCYYVIVKKNYLSPLKVIKYISVRLYLYKIITKII